MSISMSSCTRSSNAERAATTRRPLALRRLLLPFLAAVALAGCQSQLREHDPAAWHGLKISANRHYFVDAQTGAPVFLLADTAWNLGALPREEIDAYFANRAAYGFNAVMFALSFSPQAAERNAYGHAAYVGADKTELDAAFFADCDAIVQLAADRGLFVILYTMWAGKTSGTMNNYTPAQLSRIGTAVGAHFRGKKNVILCAGGEASPHYIAVESVNALGAALKAGCRGENLVTVHPVSGNSTSKFYRGAPWLDFYMSQGKSSLGEASARFDAAKLVADDWKLEETKPTLMGEHRYETGVAEDPLLQRRSLYQCVLAGAAGHAYGHNAIWQMTPHTRQPWMLKSWNPGVARWQDALNTPAVSQLHWIVRLLLSHRYLDRIPDQSLVLEGGDGPVDTRIQASRDGTMGAKDASYILAYVSSRRPASFDTSSIAGPFLNVTCFDPAAGQSQLLQSHARNDGRIQVPPVPQLTDYVIVIERDPPRP